MIKTAGILNIISGVLHLFGAIFILIFGWLGDGIFNILWYGMIGTPLTPITQPMPQELQATMAIPMFVLSVFVIIAGIYAIRGRGWKLVVIGSICVTLLTWFLGIPAIILTVMSKKEFQSIEEAGEKLVNKVLDIASGTFTKVETMKYADPTQIYLKDPCF